MLIMAGDNGVTGSFSILTKEGEVVYYSNTPVNKCSNYTKEKQYLRRLDGPKLISDLEKVRLEHHDIFHCVIERPLVNPTRFKATLSAIRCLEATLVVFEFLNIPYEYIDSKEWQKVMLPKGLQKEELKFASDQVCKRLFPKIHLSESGRGDSLLIAEYARRKHNGQV